MVKHLQIQPKDLDDYIEQMERVLRCYVRRLQWLLSELDPCGPKVGGKLTPLNQFRLITCRALSLENVEALYILTDGKPDTSCNLILREIEALTKSPAVSIHTISFNCTDRVANDFLKKLAFQTGGRYHRCHGDADGQLAAHQLLSQGFKDEEDPVFPLFEGDDLKKLVEEIDKARKYLTQAKIFRKALEIHPQPICKGV
ncbi:von Willebrand factor A domain-containing protein 3A, partial [Ophiophagus hannah]